MNKDKIIFREKVLDILEMIDKEYNRALDEKNAEEANGYAGSYAIVKLLLKL